MLKIKQEKIEQFKQKHFDLEFDNFGGDIYVFPRNLYTINSTINICRNQIIINCGRKWEVSPIHRPELYSKTTDEVPVLSKLYELIEKGYVENSKE